MLCTFDGCEKHVIAKNLCQGHYSQQKLGKELKPLHPRWFNKKETLTWYIENKSIKQGECIVPVSNQKRDYPQVRIEGKAYSLHRISYEVFNGPLEGMEVHHVCANSRCFNPEHLQLVSRLENVAEMKERKAYKKRISDLELALYELNPNHYLLEDYVYDEAVPLH